MKCANGPTLFVQPNNPFWNAVARSKLVPFGKQPASLGVDTLVGFVTRVRILREVSINRDSIASWALIDVVFKVFAITLAIDLLKQLLAAMNGNPCERHSIAAVKADL